MFEFDEVDIVDGNSSKSVKKLSKVEKLQRFENSLGSEESSFLTFNIRLAFIKIGFSYIKLII